MFFKAISTASAAAVVTSMAFAAPAMAEVSAAPSFGTYEAAQTAGMDNRDDRRDTRQDCRQAEGLGDDRRDCKHD